MTHAVDADFLVAVEIRDHLHHEAADRLLTKLLDAGHELAVAPQTLAEFVHVVSDPRRMKHELAMTEALARAENWWQASEDSYASFRMIRVLPIGFHGCATTGLGENDSWIPCLQRHALPMGSAT